MSLLGAYSTFVAVYSALFMFFPLMIVRQWVKRKSAEGFSVMTFLLVNFMMACWVKFSLLSGDSRAFYSYSFGLTMMSSYTAVFGLYTDNKKMFVVQISVLIGLLAAIFSYVDGLPDDVVRVATMGKIAALSQTAMVGGPFFQAKEVIAKGTTEYLPFGFTLLTLTMVGNRFILGLLEGKLTVALGFFPGLAMNLATLSLFYFYPPLTWRVPIIGTGPAQKKKE
ncbi:hypothetical protein PENTCL1PPCAC_1972 [Pristionchus entomophagus]|uniref:Sugar transporter SWEET n=1 Tax=Pristionchus entomophagus TaxID=358040 RepID=A0AAV5S9F8_9BILA|nr:hypothetical protein PENTCL1PPCAC_1972 [Pristionchus entomophagus]